MYRAHRILLMAGVITASLLAPSAPAVAQSAPSPAGAFADARGIIVDLTVLTAIPLPGQLGSTPLDPNTFSSASQSCPPQQEEADTDAFPGNVDASPAVTANTLNTSARADCAAPSGVAFAQTEGVTALVNAGVPLITADVIRAQANSDCTTAPNGEGSVFTNLVVAGQTISENPEPNTRITIPGIATVIINEQHPSADGRGIVVNGLHIIGASPLLRGDLVISHALSGVVCPGGPGSEVAPGLEAPDITFDKDANPPTAVAGEIVSYTATVTNTSEEACDVISFIDHLSPAVELVSTSGGFGTEPDDPAPVRGDGGQDVVLRPTDVVIAPGASVSQEIVVRLKGDVAPGTYYNNLEIFCAVNGNFASGPLAPVTVPAPMLPSEPPITPEQPGPAPEPGPRAPIAYTGVSDLAPGLGVILLLLGAGFARRFACR